MAESQALVLAGADERDLTQLSEYRAIGGYAALEKARGHDPRAGDRGDLDGDPPRPGRRRLPDGAQAQPRPAAGGGGQADVRRGERRRVRAGGVQGPGDHAPGSAPVHRGVPDRSARDRVEARLHLHPRRVRGRVRGAEGRRRRGARRGPARRHHARPPSRRRRLHLRRGVGAARVARGRAGPAAAEAAVPADLRAVRVSDADQQRPDPDHRPDHHREGRRLVREARAPRPLPAPSSTRSPGTSSGPATTSSRSARRCASSSTTSAEASRAAAS